MPKTSKRLLEAWRDVCDERLAIEVGIACLAAERSEPSALEHLDALVAQLDTELDDFDCYRQTDVKLHVGLAELTGNARLVVASTEAQGAMTDLIAHIPHPAEVLAVSNVQHARLLAAIRRGEGLEAMQIMAEHLRGTEHVLAGLLPAS
jgi:GntR family transcriptional repressor for pyruvate dehydrogenase complex